MKERLICRLQHVCQCRATSLMELLLSGNVCSLLFRLGLLIFPRREWTCSFRLGTVSSLKFVCRFVISSSKLHLMLFLFLTFFLVNTALSTTGNNKFAFYIHAQVKDNAVRKYNALRSCLHHSALAIKRISALTNPVLNLGLSITILSKLPLYEAPTI